MKILSLFLVLLVAASTVAAQTKEPARWTFAAVKISSTEYTVTATASLPRPWHLYSQRTPVGGPLPTVVRFDASPLLRLNGTVKEAGNLKKFHDKNFGVDVLYYADKVVFSQQIILKAPVKTNLTGMIEYMVCNDEMCLPPTKQKFSIALM